MPTIKDLKASLTAHNMGWSVNERLSDDMELPKYRLGGVKEGLIPSANVRPIDFKALFEAVPPNNPFILERRIAHGIVAESLVQKELRLGSAKELTPGEGGVAPASGAAVASSVDWRNRWGWAWITTIRDQAGCEACWCFASVALVEAMVRIEHCAWPWLSEGDVHKGMGKHCCDCGGADGALNWIKANAVADPGCFAWPVTSAWCSSCGGTGGGPYDMVNYTPTPDRNGRSVRIPAFTAIGSVADQKKWLDTVGPLVVGGFAVYQDFGSVGANVYRKVPTINGQPNTEEGTHVMLIVGYDDAQGCWIVKNSWGTGFGDHGFCRIAYGECDIDTYAKLGLQGTNVDPWTKRRLHNGGMLESGNGALHRNFELLTTGPGAQLHHWWRDNSAPGFPWHPGPNFGNDAAACPTLISSTFNRNFECVYLTTGRRLHHWWYDQGTSKWNDGGVFGPTDATGIPGFIQGNYGAPGNFEVVVRTADSKLNHWWRDGAGWHDGGRFGSNVAFSGATLVQSQYGRQGNFELVCVVSTGQMQHWTRDNDHGAVWKCNSAFGAGVSSPPCMIEGQFGAPNEKAVGNFELCVAVGGKVQHWWRANDSDMLWRNSATFAHDVRAVVSLVEGSYGFNLELIVLRTDNKLQHYWRDGAGWHEGPIFGSI